MSLQACLRLAAVAGTWVYAASPAWAQAPAARSTEAQAAYLIGAGDRLQLFVWKEADLTRELLVRLDGMVSVPLVGDVRAAGVTPSDLARTIEGRLGRLVNSPSVTISLLSAQSAQFYIVGRVSRAGAFPLDRPTTFLQALAVAGGFTEFAKSDRVLVFRGVRVIPVNYKKLESGSDAAENIQLVAGDTIVVP